MNELMQVGNDESFNSISTVCLYSDLTCTVDAVQTNECCNMEIPTQKDPCNAMKYILKTNKKKENVKH